MKAVLFDYPPRAVFDKAIPKARIVAHSRARGLRDRLSRELADIRWAYKLAPVSTNLSVSKAVLEIQIILLTLKPGLDNVSEATLRAIDQAVPSPILFEVRGEQGLRTVAAYKRASDAGTDKPVVGDYLWGDWLPIDSPRQPLPVALDMAGLYQELLRALIPLSARPGESLRDQLTRLAQLRVAEREYASLQARLAREAHFNRKVEINRALHKVATRLEALRSEAG